MSDATPLGAGPEDAADVLDSEALGRLICLGTDRPGSAARAIKARIDRGHPLPPSIVLVGHKGRLWLKSTVLAWLADLQAPIRPRRGGRPRKADYLAMGRSPPARAGAQQKAKREPEGAGS